MSSGSKTILGILTFLPIVFGMVFFVGYIFFIKDMVLNIPPDNDPQVFFRQYFMHLFNPAVITGFIGYILLHFGLMIWYIIHVVKNGTRTEGEKVMWILLFIFIGTIGNIIYFLVKIVSGPGAKPAYINS